MKNSNQNITHLVDYINRNSTSKEKRLDANETSMLELALEDLRARTYEVLYTDLKARAFLPTISDVDPGAETFAFEQTDEVGVAKIITNFSDDAPSVNVKSEKIRHEIVSLGDSWEYSMQDMRRAAMSGNQLDARKAKAARNAFERGLDNLAAFGSAAHNIGGFVNNSNVLVSAGTGAAWSTSNPLVQLADLNKLVADAIIGSGETITFDTVLLPLRQYLLASQTFLDTQNPRTVLESFQAANPFVTLVAPWNVLDGAGVGAKDRLVCYSRSEEVCGLVIPQEFEVLAPQPKGFAFKMFGFGRSAGTVIMRPYGLRFMDLIAS